MTVKKHEFAKMPEFDTAMRKLVATPKEVVDEAIEKERKSNRRKKKRAAKHK